MKKNSDLYDVLKMQQDEMNQLVEEEKQLVNAAKIVNDEAKIFNEKAENTLAENKEWLKSIGIFVEEEISESHEKAKIDTEQILSEIERASLNMERKTILYEDLVRLAHSKGYFDATIQEILTEDEIIIADQRLQDIENEFCEKTKLEHKDIAFLVVAIALQVVRQYVITPFTEKSTAEEASKIMDKKYGNDGKLRGKYYYATEETIIGQKKVPFDIVAGSKKYGIGKQGKGLDGNSHRFRSLGHDPILGYVFGTANIITNTVTWWNGTSHHIMYKPRADGILIPTIAANANTGKIFDAVISRFKSDGGKRILVEAIVKEHLHLKSDVSTDGLPIPFLQMYSPDFAQELAEKGLDAISLGDIAKQAAGAEFINFVISTIHSLICAENGEMDRKLYQVRTRKIILISNIIASTSNMVLVGIGAGVGIASENPDIIKKSLQKLDVGGILVTIAHLFTDLRFIAKVKEEFVKNRLDVQLEKELEKLDEFL